MNMLQETKEFVAKAFEGKSLTHFEKTIYWVKQLEPQASEAMFIAAYSHDIARAYSNEPITKFQHIEMNDPEYLKVHQEQGAQIMKEFLLKHDYDQIELVYTMIRYHEVGGTPEADLLMDADSISYLEVNAPIHAEKFVPILGREKVRRKIEWMFHRISTDKAKELAKPYFEKSLQILNNQV